MRETKKVDVVVARNQESCSRSRGGGGGGARGSLCGAVQSDQRDKRAEWSRADWTSGSGGKDE